MVDTSKDYGLDRTWDEPVREIPEAGLERERRASETERAALAKLLELPAMEQLQVRFRIRPSAGGRYILKGKLTAEVEQTCVVTLKRLHNRVEADLSAAFWPQAEIDGPVGGAVDVDDEPDLEPIEDGRLPVARVVFETLAAALDPFPRAPDAVLDWKPQEAATGTVSPFSALAKLKK